MSIMQTAGVSRSELPSYYERTLHEVNSIFNESTPKVLFTSPFLLVQSGLFDEVTNNPIRERSLREIMRADPRMVNMIQPKFRGADLVFVEENIIYASGWNSPHMIAQLMRNYRQTAIQIFVTDPIS